MATFSQTMLCFVWIGLLAFAFATSQTADVPTKDSDPILRDLNKKKSELSKEFKKIKDTAKESEKTKLRLEINLVGLDILEHQLKNAPSTPTVPSGSHKSGKKATGKGKNSTKSVKREGLLERIAKLYADITTTSKDLCIFGSEMKDLEENCDNTTKYKDRMKEVLGKYNYIDSSITIANLNADKAHDHFMKIKQFIEDTENIIPAIVKAKENVEKAHEAIEKVYKNVGSDTEISSRAIISGFDTIGEAEKVMMAAKRLNYTVSRFGDPIEEKVKEFSILQTALSTNIEEAEAILTTSKAFVEKVLNEFIETLSNMDQVPNFVLQGLVECRLEIGQMKKLYNCPGNKDECRAAEYMVLENQIYLQKIQRRLRYLNK